MLYLACWRSMYKSLPSPQHTTTAVTAWGLNKLFTNDNYCLFGYPFDTLVHAFPLLRVMLLTCKMTDTTQRIILSLAVMLVALDKYSEAIEQEGGNLVELFCLLTMCLRFCFVFVFVKKFV